MVYATGVARGPCACRRALGRVVGVADATVGVADYGGARTTVILDGQVFECVKARVAEYGIEIANIAVDLVIAKGSDNFR